MVKDRTANHFVRFLGTSPLSYDSLGSYQTKVVSFFNAMKYFICANRVSPRALAAGGGGQLLYGRLKG